MASRVTSDMTKGAPGTFSGGALGVVRRLSRPSAGCVGPLR
ncbi:hypothetical protein [Streptomyces muensis]|nr:hypothetical protein [Streptomyces muensis]